jgi:hypothetical protein
LRNRIRVQGWNVSIFRLNQPFFLHHLTTGPQTICTT